MAAAAGIRMRSSRGRLHRDQLLLRLDHVGGNREKGGDRTGGARGRKFDGRLAAMCVLEGSARHANKTQTKEKWTNRAMNEILRDVNQNLRIGKTKCQ